MDKLPGPLAADVNKRRVRLCDVSKNKQTTPGLHAIGDLHTCTRMQVVTTDLEIETPGKLRTGSIEISAKQNLI